MRPRISLDFNHIKDAELLLKANTIIAAMTDNPNFPEPWPVQVPSLQVLRDAVAAFQTAVQDALTRDTTKIILRDQAKHNLKVTQPWRKTGINMPSMPMARKWSSAA